MSFTLRKKKIFQELFIERFFGEPEMLLFWTTVIFNIDSKQSKRHKDKVTNLLAIYFSQTAPEIF